MRKTIAGLVGLFTLVATAASASSLEEIKNATYKLYDDGVPICSAVAISPTQLVTANHCVDGSSNLSISVETLDPKDLKPVSITQNFVKVVRTIKDKDVAMLQLKATNTALHVADYAVPKETKMNFGDPVIVVGYPKVMEVTMTHGEFSSMASLKEHGLDALFWKITAPVTGGNSGGGLYKEFNKGDYKLVGLTTAGFRDVSFMNYFSTVESLESVLVGLVDKKNPLELPVEIKIDIEKDKAGLVNPSDLR